MTTTRSSSPQLFKTTQSRKNIELLDDYVEAINEILNTKGSVKNVDLCKHFSESNATVSKNIKRLFLYLCTGLLYMVSGNSIYKSNSK